MEWGLVFIPFNHSPIHSHPLIAHHSLPNTYLYYKYQYLERERVKRDREVRVMEIQQHQESNSKVLKVDSKGSWESILAQASNQGCPVSLLNLSLSLSL